MDLRPNKEGKPSRKEVKMKKDKLIFQTKSGRGFVFKAWNLSDSKADALIEVEQNGKLVRSFAFPLYKVWNIAAHSDDIIQSELDKDVDGYLIAGSDGLGGNVFAQSRKEEK